MIRGKEVPTGIIWCERNFQNKGRREREQVGFRFHLYILPLLMPYCLVTLERSTIVLQPEH